MSPEAPAPLREDQFDLEAYSDEVRAAPDNTTIGSRIWFENDRVRIWDIQLAPGERVPFHCHRRTYYWICTQPGVGDQRRLDGTISRYRFRTGDVEFSVASPDAPLIHDLENVGRTTLRFSTVELLGGERA